MRVLGLLLFAGFLLSPLWLLDAAVLPQLEQLETTYSQLDVIAAKAAE